LRRRNKKTGKTITAKYTRTVEAPPDNASREAVRDILNRLFGRSAEKLVKSLADSNQLTPEEATRMKEIFGKRAKRKRRKR
jgi:predicted transcriptional regulator